MALDYVLRFPCEVRKSVPEATLATRFGYMSLAESAMAEIRRSNPEASTEAILGNYQVEVRQTRPDGTVAQAPMSIGQLVSLAQPLGQFRAHCIDCRANIADRPFGCMARINYPVRKEVESWLLARLPGDGNDPNLSNLFRFLSELEIDGRPVDVLRPRLFELQQPVVRRWDTSTGERRVTSSQTIQMLVFGGAKIFPQQAALYTRLLGLASVLSDPHPPSDNIEQFKTLMCAIVMAGRLDAEIGLDA